MERIELLILRNLLYNEEYARKVVPFIKDEYFEEQNQKIIYQEVSSFLQKYDKLATKEILYIEVEKRSDINDTSFRDISDIISSLDNEIGDPRDQYADFYRGLDRVQREYWKKYSRANNFWDYMRIIEFFDGSIWKQLRAMIPARTNATLGLLVEPNILERS